MAFEFEEEPQLLLGLFFAESGRDDLPDTPDAHRRGDQGKQEDRSECDVGGYGVSMLAHQITPVAEVQNTGDCHRQDNRIEGLRNNHDEYGSCFEDRHHQPE